MRPEDIEVLAFLDVETSDLDLETGLLLENAVALYDIETNHVIEARSWLFYAESNPAESVNAIPSSLLSKYGRKDLTEASADLVEMLLRSSVVLTWNVAFDRPWIEKWLLRNTLVDKPWVCAMDDLTWPRSSSSKSLSSTALAHEVGLVDAHRALPDVWTMTRLFRRASELGFDIRKAVAHGMRPKALFEALVSYDDKDKAKAKRFRWDDVNRRWWKNMFRDEIRDLDFGVQEIIPPEKTWLDTHQGLRVLVCGGRNYDNSEFEKKVLQQLKPREIVVGCAAGADQIAREWAAENDIPCTMFKADWEGQGRAAGPIRNERMLSEGNPELIVAFPGGAGTENMVEQSRNARVEVIRPVPRKEES